MIISDTHAVRDAGACPGSPPGPLRVGSLGLRSGDCVPRCRRWASASASPPSAACSASPDVQAGQPLAELGQLGTTSEPQSRTPHVGVDRAAHHRRGEMVSRIGPVTGVAEIASLVQPSYLHPAPPSIPLIDTSGIELTAASSSLPVTVGATVASRQVPGTRPPALRHPAVVLGARGRQRARHLQPGAPHAGYLSAATTSPSSGFSAPFRVPWNSKPRWTAWRSSASSSPERYFSFDGHPTGPLRAGRLQARSAARRSGAARHRRPGQPLPPAQVTRGVRHSRGRGGPPRAPTTACSSAGEPSPLLVGGVGIANVMVDPGPRTPLRDRPAPAPWAPPAATSPSSSWPKPLLAVGPRRPGRHCHRDSHYRRVTPYTQHRQMLIPPRGDVRRNRRRPSSAQSPACTAMQPPGSHPRQPCAPYDAAGGLERQGQRPAKPVTSTGARASSTVEVASVRP